MRILQVYREKQNLTQTALAEQLGISRPTYIKWERDGKYPLLRPAAITQLAELFELSEDDVKQNKEVESYELRG